MNSLSPYPWQQSQWSLFHEQIANKRLAHGILLSGQQGTGKWHFGHLMAKYLLCQNPIEDLSCGKCRSCQLFEAGTHPDLMVVMPEDHYKPIKIDQIRSLSNFVSSTAQQGGFQVVLMGPIEQLNVNAANALLKNLEEPAGETVLILVSHVMSLVMPTLRSRCQLIAMGPPSLSQSEHWLQDLGISDDIPLFLAFAANAPLKAKELALGAALEGLAAFLKGLHSLSHGQEMDVAMVRQWLDVEIGDIVGWWVQLLVITVTGHSGDYIAQAEDGLSELGRLFVQLLKTLAKVNPKWLYKFMDRLLLIKKQQLTGANPNKQLLLEDLMIDWYKMLAASPVQRLGTA